MTRKCALCKETNYKKNYSFFSAPKDPEIRKKWQIALGIKNYSITDDIYVCSRHFHKNDIITHWVSGIPPQVIKIKYKKCRLRPGAVPGKNFYSSNNSQSVDKDALSKSEEDMNNFLIFRKKESADLLKDEKIFLISTRKNNQNDNECIDDRNTNVYYQMYSKLQNCAYNINENFEHSNVQLLKDMDKVDINVSTQNLGSKEPKFKRNELNKTFGHDDNCSTDVFIETKIESVDLNRKGSQILDKPSHAITLSKTVENSIKICDSLKEDRTSLEIWEHNVTSPDSKKSVNSNLKMTNDLYINNKVLAALNYDHLNTQNKIVHINKNEILFEDFLEVYTEVSIPRGWSCLVTSKGHNTTVVYLCMGITKDGLPFVEKQVFIKSDMILHCAVANREIDPFVHNLLKEDRHIKVKSLLDIEQLIDEFDQRVVCQGIHDVKDHKDVDMIEVAYKDGIKWRHIFCSLIVNNNVSRCTKCAVLFRTLVCKSKKSYAIDYDDSVKFTKPAKKYTPHSKSKNL